MFWATVAAVGISAIAKLGSAQAQDEAAQEGYNIRMEQAALKREENAENERRTMRQIKQVEGEARARQFAGGAGGATASDANTNRDLVLGALYGENAKQFEWLQVSGESQAKAIERGAEYERMIGEAQADATRWGAVSDIAKGVATMDYAGVFESWGGKNPIGSQYSWMNPTSINRRDILQLDSTNFNIFGRPQ